MERIKDDFPVPRAQFLSLNYSQCIDYVIALTPQDRIILISLRNHIEEKKGT